MFSSWNFRALDLEAFENKPRQVLEFQAKEHSNQQCRCSNFKPNFDLDMARISQNSKHESCRALSWRSIAS